MFNAQCIYILNKSYIIILNDHNVVDMINKQIRSHNDTISIDKKVDELPFNFLME